MKIPLKLFTLWSFLILRCIAAPSDPTMEKIASYESVDGKFNLVEYKKPPLDFPTTNEFWVEPTSDNGKPQLIFSHSNRANALVSASGASIAIDYHESSGDGLVFVFARLADGTFKRHRSELRDLAKPILEKFVGNQAASGFDHFYCYSDIWINDRYLLAHLEGNNSGVFWLDPWYFIFDTKSGKLSRDLNQANKDVFFRTNSNRTK